MPNPEKYIFAYLDFQQCVSVTVEEFLQMLYSEIEEKLPETVKVKQMKDYKTFTSMLKTLNKSGYKLILLFDEFEEILSNENLGGDFFSYLRSIANRYDVAYVVSTKRNLIDLSREELLGSPFFNIFTTIHLGLFQENEALDLIKIPSAEGDIPLVGESAFILRNAGLFPFFIQLLCNRLFDHKMKQKKEGRSLEIHSEDYEKILTGFREDADSHFRKAWDGLHREEKDLLAEIAKENEIKDENEFSIRNLMRKGYLITANKKEKIFSNAFQEFILDISKVSERSEKKNLEQKLHETMLEYSHELKWIRNTLSGVLALVLGTLGKDYFSEKGIPPISSWRFLLLFVLVFVVLVLTRFLPKDK
jgi:serine/threonine-protein kinase